VSKLSNIKLGSMDKLYCILFFKSVFFYYYYLVPS